MTRAIVDPAVVEAFDTLAERLARPESWIKGKFARTSRRGRKVGPGDPGARCWCLQGAIWTLPLVAATQTQIYMALRRVLPHTEGEKNPVTAWNDERQRTHAEVLDAIARAKAAYLAGGAS